MIDLTVKDITRFTGGEHLSTDENRLITGFSINSRDIKPGQFFIAIKGNNFDGHDFIPDAIKKSAGGIISDRPLKGTLKSIKLPVVLVADTIKAMGDIAGGIREISDVPAICITGTNGKTTVKDMLAHILSANHKVLKSRKSFNNIIGLSLTLFDLDDSYDVVVLEIGTNHPGEIARLADIASPNMVIITNIGNAHLEAFADTKSIFTEKSKLIDFLPEDGMVLMNKDDSLLERSSVRGPARKFYGSKDGCDYRITQVVKKDNGFSFLLNGNEFFLPLEGGHNVHNASAAIAIAEHFGMDYATVKERLRGVSLPGMHLEKMKMDEVVFINDSYNANPDSFECALKVLIESTDGSLKGVVAGDMLELGEASEEFHRMVGRSIAEKGVDFLVVLGKRAMKIADGALKAGMKEDRILCGQTHEDAARMLKYMVRPDTIVLLKGSRAAKMEEVIKCFTISCTH